jgi:hypothetical protein
VHAVYEACGFGFALQRQLSALSVRSLSKRPMRVHGPEPGAHAQEQRAMVTVQPALSQMAPYAQEQGSGQQAPGHCALVWLIPLYYLRERRLVDTMLTGNSGKACFSQAQEQGPPYPPRAASARAPASPLSKMPLRVHETQSRAPGA